MEERVVTTMAALLWGGDSVLPGGSYLLHLSLLERREGRVLMALTILIQYYIISDYWSAMSWDRVHIPCSLVPSLDSLCTDN